MPNCTNISRLILTEALECAPNSQDYCFSGEIFWGFFVPVTIFMVISLVILLSTLLKCCQKPVPVMRQNEIYDSCYSTDVVSATQNQNKRYPLDTNRTMDQRRQQSRDSSLIMNSMPPFPISNEGEDDTYEDIELA